MELAKEISDVQSAMEMVMHQLMELDFHLEEKLLDERNLELDSKERDLAIRRKRMESDLEGIMRKKIELDLGKKKLANLEEGLKIKTMMFDFNKDSSPIHSEAASMMKVMEKKRTRNGVEIGESSGLKRKKQPRISESMIRDKSASKMKVMERKRTRNAVEIGESSGHKRKKQPQTSGTQTNVHGLSYLVTINASHMKEGRMFVPRGFLAAFDIGMKKTVILLSQAGSFSLDVKEYTMPSGRCVLFTNGVRDFCSKNGLRPGMKCLFSLKEHSVNGDPLISSMDVSVLVR